MADEIRVLVVNYKRKSLYMRYTDPLTGKQHTRSTGTKRRTEAERIAAKWEAELQEGRYKAPSKVSWAEFRQRYEDEVLSGLADKTDSKVSGVFNSIERIVKPTRLAELTANRISTLQSKLREEGRSESTIKGHLAHLKASLNWANRVGLLNEVPKIDMPRRAKASKVMKGRPVTAEEYERMLDKVATVLFPPDRKKHTPHEPTPEGKGTIIESWLHYLRGLWWSGLRLEESLELWWDRDDKLCVDLSGVYPMLWIPAELEKGNQDRLLPISPEFAEFLQATPDAERTGPVFSPLPVRGWATNRLCAGSVGRTVSDIGKRANVKVHTDTKSGKVKYASAHDLRRSFGERWASRVMPQVLMELMRHESINTTLKFYVGRNANTTAAALYAAVSGNTSGNTRENSRFALAQEKAGSSFREKLSAK